MNARLVSSRTERVLRWPTAVVLAFGLATAAQAQSQQDLGTFIGAGLGGLFGSQIGSGSGRTAAIIGGVIFGGLIGNTIGRHMDENDRRRAAEVLDSTPSGETVSWRNPDTGHDFSMTPVNDYQSDQGHACRKFVQEIIVDGERQQVEGTACKEPDGTDWTTS